MSVKSKHSASKKDKNGKKEKKKNLEDSDEEIESSEEELDLTKECHPIGYYINDRAEMINQMFSVIKGNKLKAMLPPILKDCDADQLKLQCLDQLLGMSEKRIMCILEGGTLDSSSESEVQESDENNSDEKNGTISGSSSDDSEESHENEYTNNKKQKKRKGTSVGEKKGGKVPKTGDENSAPEQGKTLLEILELEMRARAIRALLKQSGSEKEAEPENDENKTNEGNANGVKIISGEVVDLTECEDEEFPVSVKKEKSETNDIDEKVLTFEKKIEKSKGEKSNSVRENEKSKKLQAELELRNKLFKKKIYRTRQQRMENEEEEESNVQQTSEPKTEDSNNDPVVVKTEPTEPKEPVEIVVEDPEEGEISSSEDDFPVEIKQEVVEPEEKTPEETLNFESKIDEDSERVTAIDNGTFVNNSNLDNMMETSNNDVLELEISQEENLINSADESQVLQEPQKSDNETNSGTAAETQEIDKNEVDTSMEETSWRDRWLRKDGVQKLVKSSKIYAKVKKRIAEKSQKAKEEAPCSQDANISESKTTSKIEVIEGSIEEYKRLSGKTLEQTRESNAGSNGDLKS